MGLNYLLSRAIGSQEHAAEGTSTHPAYSVACAIPVNCVGVQQQHPAISALSEEEMYQGRKCFRWAFARCQG